MLFVFALLHGWTFQALLLWGSIELVDRHNPRNRFAMALVFSALQMALSLVMMAAGVLALAGVVLWFMWLYRFLTRHYELSAGKAILVILILIAVPSALLAMLPTIAMLLGPDQLMLLMYLLLAMPVFILGGWQYFRWKARRSAVHHEMSTTPAGAPVPVARVVRVRQKTAPAVVPIEPRPAIAPPPAVRRDPAAPGEPTLLR